TREFYWHEGHTAHRTEEEAEREALLILDIYREFVEQVLAIPVLVGRKPPSERFAGAQRTYTLEALMPDAQAIQAGTSHYFGQNFGRAFDIRFLDADNQEKYVSTTSWAISSRIIGALVMAHGDDRGLQLPPAIAPYQVVIVPIPGKDGEMVRQRAAELAARLEQRFRVTLDDREQYTPGWKFHEWELRGVPVRLELGPRDLPRGQVVLVPRTGGEKETVALERLEDALTHMLDTVQQSLFERGQAYLRAHIVEARTVDEVAAHIQAQRGFVRVRWCEAQACEDRLREATGASPRVIPLDDVPEGACIVCGQPARATVYWARAY
ncbi:MAG: His/Gly/Thr/Pro-type tRNA ligase C-terminal domain-containing protein, partial [Armatimonadota bacterium]|nr:His/Gly/Thr/Pro-type tRNA ligase C-terminal domain-containing protein [Armatimonadota bacterium]